MIKNCTFNNIILDHEIIIINKVKYFGNEWVIGHIKYVHKLQTHKTDHYTKCIIKRVFTWK